MERSKICDEILTLVDSSPMNDVDIAPIIAKHTNANMLVDEQMQIRGVIVTVLKDLKADKEIDFNDSRLSELLSAGGGVFGMFNFVIRGTRQRHKEQEKAEKPQPTIGTQNVVHNNSGTIMQSGQESRFENLPINLPTNIPANSDINISNKTFWSKLSDWILTNIGKILLAVIAGLIVAYLVFKLGWRK